MNENLDIEKKNLGINTLQSTPTPAIYLLGTIFTVGVVIGSIFGTIMTKPKER
jgi:hypothetical protein